MTKKIILITGASGFLGAHVARTIYNKWSDVGEIRLFDCRAPNMTFITTLTKQHSENGKTNGFHHSLPDAPKLCYFPGNVLDFQSLTAAMDQVDAVIHCAAVVETGSLFTRRRMDLVNVEGTRNVIKASLHCGVSALVATGSVFQFLTPHCCLKGEDESLLLPNQNNTIFPAYGRSKATAEKLVLEASGSKGKDGTRLNTCCLRCTGMFGETDNNLVPQAVQIAQRCCGYFPASGKATNQMQSLYVGNAAWAHLLATQALLDDEKCSRVQGQTYFLGDHTPITNNTDFFRMFLIPMGYKITSFRFPKVLIFLLAYLMELALIVFTFLGVDFKSSLNLGAVYATHLSYTFNWGKVKRDIGYKPLFTHKEALNYSIEYYSTATQKT